MMYNFYKDLSDYLDQIKTFVERNFLYFFCFSYGPPV
jgi:hypothetical protein